MVSQALDWQMLQLMVEEQAVRPDNVHDEAENWAQVLVEWNQEITAFVQVPCVQLWARGAVEGVWGVCWGCMCCCCIKLQVLLPGANPNFHQLQGRSALPKNEGFIPRHPFKNVCA